MGQRTWIKIYCDKWLSGSLRKETVTTRGVWIDVLNLAGNSAYGDHGLIQITPHMGLSDSQICKIIGVSIRTWGRAKKRLKETERIEVDKNNVISIVNWHKYQSEYGRIKSTTQSTGQKRSRREVEVEEDTRVRATPPKFHHLLDGFQFFEKEKTIQCLLIENLAEKFGTQTVLDELFAANNYLVTHPKRQKELKNFGQFISNWFKKVKPLQDITEGTNPADLIVCSEGHTYHTSNNKCPDCQENEKMRHIDDYTPPEIRSVIGELAAKKAMPDA